MVTMQKEESEIKKVAYFFCYNPRLRKYLSQNGLTWIGKDIHGETGKTYWMFAQSEELSHLILKYKKGN